MNSLCIGVFMDYSHAVFIDPSKTVKQFETVMAIKSAHAHIKGETSNKTRMSGEGRSNNEAKTHHKETTDQKYFFKILKDRLKMYDEIFLFGPTDASRLFKKDIEGSTGFKRKNVSWKRTGKMTGNQMLKLVRGKFSLL